MSGKKGTAKTQGEARTASGSIGRSAASPLTAPAALRFAPSIARERHPSPAGALLYLLHLLNLLYASSPPFSQSVACVRSLEAWRLGFCGYRRFAQRSRPSPRRGVLCSPFSVLRSPGGIAAPRSSCPFVSAPQGKPSTFSHRPARRALAARSVAVEGLALRACTLRSLWPWKVCRFAPARSVLRGASAPLGRPSLCSSVHPSVLLRVLKLP